MRLSGFLIRLLIRIYLQIYMKGCLNAQTERTTLYCYDGMAEKKDRMVDIISIDDPNPS